MYLSHFTSPANIMGNNAMRLGEIHTAEIEVSIVCKKHTPTNTHTHTHTHTHTRHNGQTFAVMKISIASHFSPRAESKIPTSKAGHTRIVCDNKMATIIESRLPVSVKVVTLIARDRDVIRTLQSEKL